MARDMNGYSDAIGRKEKGDAANNKDHEGVVFLFLLMLLMLRFDAHDVVDVADDDIHCCHHRRHHHRSNEHTGTTLMT